MKYYKDEIGICYRQTAKDVWQYRNAADEWIDTPWFDALMTGLCEEGKLVLDEVSESDVFVEML